MSATITTLHDFVEALAIRVPYDDIHPMSQCFMHEDISSSARDGAPR